jgi:hypothetical protein
MQLSSYEKLGKWRTSGIASAKLPDSNFGEARTVRVLYNEL